MMFHYPLVLQTSLMNAKMFVGISRVHGEKVAEIPLIATLFKHRKLGMCRALMNQLEKVCTFNSVLSSFPLPFFSRFDCHEDLLLLVVQKLVELGVQRLVLPALPDAMNTWTGSFGFSVMSKAERQDFVDNTFLNFNGTIMCQKLLLLQSQSTYKHLNPPHLRCRTN